MRTERRRGLRTLVEDETGALSSSRCGMWATLCFTFWYIGYHPVPSTAALSTLATMFVCFAGWAAGSKYATAWGSLGAVAQGVASVQPPYPEMDHDERG